MADDTLTQPEDVFEKTITTLETYSKAQEQALLNKGQSAWMTFSEKANTKKELLTDLDREDLNKKYVKIMDDAPERRLFETVALTLQNDFVGAIARDFYDIRRSRLTRIFHQTAVHNGKVGGEGTLKLVMRASIVRLFKQDETA